MKVVSFFSGCGGLDLGFEQAGFEVIWANDNDPAVFETYLLNHPHTYLCRKDMRELTMEEIPECDGFIGGPPCQSWSEGGKQQGCQPEGPCEFSLHVMFRCCRSTGRHRGMPGWMAVCHYRCRERVRQTAAAARESGAPDQHQRTVVAAQAPPRGHRQPAQADGPKASYRGRQPGRPARRRGNVRPP